MARPPLRSMSAVDLEDHRQRLIRKGSAAGYNSPTLADVRRRLRDLAEEQTRRAEAARNRRPSRRTTRPRREPA